MSETSPSLSSRERTRAQLVEVAAELLATSGRDAVTTRSVALAAGVQAPTIYRIFGDKSGLLDAVAEHGFAAYLAQKAPVGQSADPVEGLRAGFELHIGFGLANPELFRLMHTALRTPDGQAAAATGSEVLKARIHRVAEAGRLRVTERRANELIRAAGTGVVFTLIDQAEDERDERLVETAWDAVCAAILVDSGDGVGPGAAPGTKATSAPEVAAVTLLAALPELPALPALSEGERALLREWLDRIAAAR